MGGQEGWITHACRVYVCDTARCSSHDFRPFNVVPFVDGAVHCRNRVHLRKTGWRVLQVVLQSKPMKLMRPA